MKKNSFENVYGFLMRQLAKSILTEFKKKYNSEYLTIGILLYKSFNESFYYAPTLKNSLVSPDEIFSDGFPTEQKSLWDKNATIALGHFLSNEFNKERVNYIFDENTQLADYEASSYAILYETYKEHRRQWREWFNENIHHFRNPKLLKRNTIKSARLVNQLFYFGNYLITITPKAAFKSRSSEITRTNGENIYLCVSNASLMKTSQKFDYKKGVLDKGVNIPWKTEPDSQERRANLILALEVYYRWPFNVHDKIAVLDALSRKDSYASKSYFIDATGTPLMYNGEFLGIGYISRPHEEKKVKGREKKRNEDKARFANDLFQRKIKESSLPKFLYNGRFETARKALQKITNATYAKKTADRIFELSYIYSSAPLVAFIDENGDLFCNVAHFTDSTKRMERIKSNIPGHRLIGFLQDYFQRDLNLFNRKEKYLWLDVFEEFVTESNEAIAFEKIAAFNEQLANLFKDSFTLNPEQFQFTSLSILSFEIDEGVYTLIFFNSNFTLLFNPGTYNLTVKNSYALANHNWIRLLIDSELAHRKLYEQNMSFEDNMRKTFLHYFKGVLKHRIIDQLVPPFDSVKGEKIRENCNDVVDNLGKLLGIYNLNAQAGVYLLKDILDCWNNCLTEYDQKHIALVPVSLDKLKEFKIICNLEALKLVFTELIQNAINISRGKSEKNCKAFLAYKVNRGLITFFITNTGTTMQTKYIEKAGLEAISGTESSGLGFFIVELILVRIGAVREGNRHFDLRNILSPKAVEIKFTFKSAAYEDKTNN